MGKNSFPKTVQCNLTTTCSHALPQIKEQVEHAIAILETGKKLDKINFRKDLWDCYWEWEKIGQWVTDTSPVTTPETIAGRISAPVPFFLGKWRLSVCHLDVQLTLARRYGNFFHSFIGCSCSDIQYKFVIQHTQKKKEEEAKTPKGVGATGLYSRI